MTDLITDEIVLKAIKARGSNASAEGIGAVMRRALEAVAHDIVNRYYEIEYKNRSFGEQR
jgi:hypothetical protein